MKIRNGFVSNSSSSSFICDVCGYTQSGWDMTLEEAEMYECENGHTFCAEHLISLNKENLEKYINYIIEKEEIKEEDIKNWLDLHDYKDLSEIKDICDIEDLSKEYGYGEGGRYDIPEYCCPLCNFEELSQADAREYLYKTTGISPSIVFEEIKKINKRRKKIRDSEYVSYVLNKQGRTETELLKEIEERFKGSYKEFRKFL